MCLHWLCINSEVTLNAGARNNWCRQIGFTALWFTLRLVPAETLCWFKLSLSVISLLLLQGPAFVFLSLGAHVYTAFCAPSLRGQPTPLKQTHPAGKKKRKKRNVTWGADPSSHPLYMTKEWARCRSLITIEWRGVGMSSECLLDLAAAGNTQAVSMNMKLF